MANNISKREADIDAPTGDFDQIPRLEENLTFSSTLVGSSDDASSGTDSNLGALANLIFVTVLLFILRSQLYSIVDDRTQTLRREKVLRVFKLNTGQYDHAIIFLDNYLCQMEKVVKRFEEKDEDILECKLLSRGGKVKDEHISLLINSGFLCKCAFTYSITRQLIDQNVHWSVISNIGSVLKGLSQKGNSFSSKPQEMQINDDGSFREDGSSIFSTNEISPLLRSSQNCQETDRLSCSSLKRLKNRNSTSSPMGIPALLNIRSTSSSEYVGCSRQRGAVADDLKAAGPTTKYNSWWHARLRRAGGEPVQQDFGTKEIQLTDSLP
ncbi:hypothetical protein DVH24_028776 [Malus domestica]|uniref:Uncharacterized protein n=1 Tax=Malus domestica TaxID=3750 RepID=A0A498IVJ0_MALDO|nr:hypothetical protein DVH24_028776 [Malus domestica]